VRSGGLVWRHANPASLSRWKRDSCRGTGGYAALTRCSPRNVPAAASATSWRFSEVFDRWAAMAAAGRPWPRTDPNAARKSASRAPTLRGTGSPAAARFMFALAKTRLCRRDFSTPSPRDPDSWPAICLIAWRAPGQPLPRGGARLVFLGSFAWQVL